MNCRPFDVTRPAAVANKMSCVVPYVGWCWQQMLMLRIFSAAAGVRSWKRAKGLQVDATVD